VRVLLVHNAYQQRGGEDSVVASEGNLLRDHGHAVMEITRHNDDVARMGRLRLVSDTLWSTRTLHEMERAIGDFQPDIVHVHNTFPLLSPSVYWAADRLNVPVVQTLHNFRLMCPQAMFLRDGKVCEDCLGTVPWRGAMRGCYRGSRMQSAVLAGMVTLHRGVGTWQRKVTRYIALNEFCRRKFMEGGLPSDRLVVKPNFVERPKTALKTGTPRDGFLFVGRLSPEKGVEVLIEAMQQSELTVERPTVSVVGDGPLAERVRAEPSLRWYGAQTAPAVAEAMARAAMLVLPSVWYENFPRTLVEAFAQGLPVLASRIGALAELIEDGVTGLLFEAGDAQDLARKMAWAKANPQAVVRMGQAARERYERDYTPEVNYGQLMTIYQQARDELTTRAMR
jgi:glycosyltransferase involved in cell wall biosynthesis